MTRAGEQSRARQAGVTRAGRTRRAALSVLVVLAAVILPSAITSSVAAETPPPVTIAITSLTPLAPLATDTLTLTGTVANTSGETVLGVTVRLRVGGEPLADRKTLVDISNGTSSPNGSGVGGTRTPPIADLRPGQTAPFILTVPMATLALGSAGVYLLAVEAQSDPGDGNLTRVGLGRTFLPWLPSPAETPVTGLVTLWPLTDTPAVDSDGVLLNDQIPRDVSPGGRLRVLVDAGSPHGSALTWLVDPALLETVDAMTSGYRVHEGNQLVAGTASDQAATWLDAVRRVTAQSAVLALPYACPDDVALVRGSMVREVVRAITSAAPRSSATLRHPVVSTLAWPDNGFVDEPTLRAISDAAPLAVLVSGSQLRSESDFTPTGLTTLPSSVGSGTAVISDPALSSIAAGTHESAADILQARQRLISDLALIGLELPATQRTVVIAPPLQWSSNSAFLTEMLTAITTVPWVRPTSLPALLGAEPSSVPRTLKPYPSSATKAELNSDYVSRIAAAQTSTTLVSDVIAGSAVTTAAINESLARSASSAFRADRALGLALIASARADVSRMLSGVRIVSKGSVTLPGDTGFIPISIANTLDSPVTVSLSIQATPSVRLSTSAIEPVTVPAQSTTLVEVPARVTGSDPVSLTVRLTAPGGAAFGAPAQMQVGSSAYSRAAAWVVGAAFAVLVILLLINAGRRVRGSTHRGRPAPPVDGTMDE